MPVSIVIGGQFGSEGKGKVALELVRQHSRSDVTVVRVGGPNSGHTAYDRDGNKWALRQMPAACLDRNVDVVFPAGSYIEPELLLREITDLDYPLDRVRISPFARVITDEHRDWEKKAGITKAIGSTGSGVGAAVLAAIARNAENLALPSPSAGENELLRPFTCDVGAYLDTALSRNGRIIIEGTQGFGLSLLDGGFWPQATARYTTAAGALAEAGLSPRVVDNVTLVLRSYPIRVAGESGPLVGELTWEEVGRRTGKTGLQEFTTVTQKLRRVGEFEPYLVKRAISVNRPDHVVINHMDYIGEPDQLGRPGTEVENFLEWVTSEIGPVHLLGFSPNNVVHNTSLCQLKTGEARR
ncbi:adenylosuccinate synthetase [Rhizobium wenxiniae]|uniref:Adenylosuccinate synthetase n=1 Tax=Rhizobium wenxiniae TaxID=1737357 RepID=A0A7W9Y388_9HYPH|nr:adenylosuccinate synthetase [Rhizobium wenxiniae]MBB6161205.1 adenylosuccinate synthase [Rhizobium wenxiniae]GGF87133.1 adenylosuccinate synthetase [Rhizobium wenxiniae]